MMQDPGWSMKDGTYTMSTKLRGYAEVCVPDQLVYSVADASERTSGTAGSDAYL